MNVNISYKRLTSQFSELHQCLLVLKNNQLKVISVPKRHILGWHILVSFKAFRDLQSDLDDLHLCFFYCFVLITIIVLYSPHKYLWSTFSMPGNVLGCILDNTISDLTEILLYWGRREKVNKQAITTHCEKCYEPRNRRLCGSLEEGEIPQLRVGEQEAGEKASQRNWWRWPKEEKDWNDLGRETSICGVFQGMTCLRN